MLLWYKPLDVRVSSAIPLLSNGVEEILESLPFQTVHYDAVSDEREQLLPYKPYQRNASDPESDVVSTCLTLALILPYGGWHILAWNFSFPTNVELILWRICAILTAVSILCFAFALVVNEHFKSIDNTTVFSIVMLISVGVYTLARVVITVEVFIDLRALPPDAFKTVRWTTFVPHL